MPVFWAFRRLGNGHTAGVWWVPRLGDGRTAGVFRLDTFGNGPLAVAACNAAPPSAASPHGMKLVSWDDPDPRVVWDNPNLRWGDPSFLLEEGDPGWVPWPPVSTPVKPKKKKRSYKMANPTPESLNELIAAGEDMCDGLENLEATIGIEQNTFAKTRADLDALIAANNAFKAADGEKPAAALALRLADSNAKAFIAACVKVFSITLGNGWSDAWVATGLPNSTVGVPGKQDERFTALTGLKAFLTVNPTFEVTTPKVEVTAARATTLHTALSAAREGVNMALDKAKGKLLLREPLEAQFRHRYRAVVHELDGLLDDEDSRWYQFGLNRPADPATPGAPFSLQASAIGGGKVLAQISGARRANSFNFYKQVVGTDPEPVKLENTPATQLIIEELPMGATVNVTVTGVNNAGEGPASDPVNVVVT
jgi:hypothetical protein